MAKLGLGNGHTLSDSGVPRFDHFRLLEELECLGWLIPAQLNRPESHEALRILRIPCQSGAEGLLRLRHLAQSVEGRGDSPAKIGRRFTRGERLDERQD